MSEAGGIDIFTPGEGGKGPLESLSEDAKQRFAAAAQAMQQLRRDEKRAKKKDDQVARTIIQFLHDPAHTHLFILVSRLVGRNCPSIFILGILSLIHADCLKVVEEYFAEEQEPGSHETVEAMTALVEGADLKEGTNRKLIDWITRLQMILTHDAERILGSLLIDERRIDGSVLQLTTFVLQEFFVKEEHKDLSYEKAQPLTASILQTVFEPFLHAARMPALEENRDEREEA